MLQVVARQSMRSAILRSVVMIVALLIGVGMVTGIGAFSDRRLIIAFGTTGSSEMALWESLAEQRRCQLLDREVDAYSIDTDEIAALASADGGAAMEPHIASLAAYRGESEFELVLVGKDGGVKARAENPHALDAFLNAIDRMPMRRSEMRQRGGADVDC